jgi:hypothetical protein
VQQHIKWALLRHRPGLVDGDEVETGGGRRR